MKTFLILLGLFLEITHSFLQKVVFRGNLIRDIVRRKRDFIHLIHSYLKDSKIDYLKTNCKRRTLATAISANRFHDGHDDFYHEFFASA